MPEPTHSAHFSGQITTGARFVWRPDEVHSRCLIEVGEVRDNGDEIWIECVVGEDQSDGKFPRMGAGDTYWNDESLFREAVVPA